MRSPKRIATSGVVGVDVALGESRSHEHEGRGVLGQCRGGRQWVGRRNLVAPIRRCDFGRYRSTSDTANRDVIRAIRSVGGIGDVLDRRYLDDHT
jgi:hypothetical protein